MIPSHNLRRFLFKALKQPGYAFSVFIKRARAYFYYSFGNGRSSYPEAITLFLTHRCNLHCKMCGQWGEGGVTRKQGTECLQDELTLDEFKSLIDDVRVFKPNITLFGGEPLLYPHCLELIKYIKNKKMHCLMITNGSLLKDTACGIVTSGLDELNVSLDGGVELHDAIRTEPGVFNKIMEGLKQVDYFKKQKNKNKPLVNLQCTINKYNYRFLEQLIPVAKEAKASSLTFHNLIFVNRESLNRQKPYDALLGCSSCEWEGFAFEPEINPELLYEKMDKIISGKYPFNVDFYPKFSRQELIEYYKNRSYFSAEYPLRCVSPWIAVYIFPDGRVGPCLNSQYSYGNVREGKFGGLWNNEKALKFRQLLRKNKIFPVCVRCTEMYRY